MPGQAGGVCVAVNWWYEVSSRARGAARAQAIVKLTTCCAQSQAAFGPQWAMLDFIKAMGDEAGGKESEGGEQGTR